MVKKKNKKNNKNNARPPAGTAAPDPDTNDSKDSIEATGEPPALTPEDAFGLQVCRPH